jgi:hypothetical protein
MKKDESAWMAHSIKESHPACRAAPKGAGRAGQKMRLIIARSITFIGSITAFEISIRLSSHGDGTKVPIAVRLFDCEFRQWWLTRYPLAYRSFLSFFYPGKRSRPDGQQRQWIPSGRKEQNE